MDLKTVHLLVKHSTTELYHQPTENKILNKYLRKIFSNLKLSESDSANGSAADIYLVWVWATGNHMLFFENCASISPLKGNTLSRTFRPARESMCLDCTIPFLAMITLSGAKTGWN
jgi:hypothetical protein